MRPDVASLLRVIRENEVLADALRYSETLPSREAILAPNLPAGFAALAPILSQRRQSAQSSDSGGSPSSRSDGSSGDSTIGALYQHQHRALELLSEGRDVALATPTASGKTLVYNLPALRAILQDPSATALYLFPLKALEQDQHKRLHADIAALGWEGTRIRVGVYDGDTPPGLRKKLRDDPPNVLITTPDMLHMGILPSHQSWREFFRGLRFVVLDELHTYRGIFGSHIAQVMRRLIRVARFHGAQPQFVAASATIANPGELATTLTGRRFEVVSQDASPKTQRNVLLFRPKTSPYTLAAHLFRESVGLGLRTIAFTKARTVTELMYTWICEAQPALANQISAYRAGFLPEERRQIEERLFSGELKGVISTSALEMGIDVGGLDVCILVGYPGSQIATWQRAGRVGRTREALIALVAQPDALDQYLVSHPRLLFEGQYEHAVADAHNSEIAAAHLPCAAAELPLAADEAWLQEPEARANTQALEEAGALLCSEAGNRWFAARRRPHRDVNLRSAGSGFSIVCRPETSEASSAREERGHPIGSIGASRVWAECHEGAIYLHRGRQYLVEELVADLKLVRVRAVRSQYYTRAVSEKETEILSRARSRPVGNFLAVQGRLKVTTTITGFERRRVHGQEVMGSEPLHLPPTHMETTGIWLEIPDEIPDAVSESGGHPMGAIHAIEHAALALFPLFALCDRHDVAGISKLRHPQVGKAAIFLYDSHAGGVGIAVNLFDRLESLLETALEMLRDCECEDGCPACVHSPKCGSGNRPIDKQAAQSTLRLLLAHEALPEPRGTGDPAVPTASPPTPATCAAPSQPSAQIVYFDLETQRSAAEVGGWHNAHLMRVALACLFDSRSGAFETYFERDVDALLKKLRDADLVVGFNVLRFDYAVLSGYAGRDLSDLRTFDVLQDIHQRLGFRLSLGHLATETLGAAKSADGLQSLQWWKEGRVEEIERYCRQDVALVRDLLAFGCERGHLFFRTKTGERVRLPARWSLAELVEAGHTRSVRVRDGEPGVRPLQPGPTGPARPAPPL